MPRYDYRCSVCDAVFEVTHAAGDATEKRCPECHSPAKRVFAPVGVVFKGSGFHNTDYRAKPKDEGPSSNGSAGSASPSCGSASSCASCPAAGD